MLFSIVMCTLNSAVTLHYAIDSVRNQSFSEWELIVLDNGSHDGTVEILMKYQREDSRITCLFRENNVGWPKGISICLGQAQGRYMMFLGADDYLAKRETLQEVSDEIIRNQPDIVWTGWGSAILENEEHTIVRQKCPEYKIYDGGDKLAQVAAVMQNVYYNSVMHYVNIKFLKRHGIDFYQPFYGDCMGMTEALCKAKKMVVMDKIEYILTVNTSQTSSKTGFDYDISTQWESVKKTIGDLRKCPMEPLGYIAVRILNNLSAMCENILMGGMLRNKWMNPVERTLPERFLQAEKWISSDAFGEMMYYSDRKLYGEKLIGAAGVLFWVCRKQEELAGKIRRQSHWLADFVETSFECNNLGEIQWKLKFTKPETQILLGALECSANKHRIGVELLLMEDIEYEDTDFRKAAEEILKQYKKSYRYVSGSNISL